MPQERSRGHGQRTAPLGRTPGPREAAQRMEPAGPPQRGGGQHAGDTLAASSQAPDPSASLKLALGFQNQEAPPNRVSAPGGDG